MVYYGGAVVSAARAAEETSPILRRVARINASEAAAEVARHSASRRARMRGGGHMGRRSSEATAEMIVAAARSIAADGMEWESEYTDAKLTPETPDVSKVYLMRIDPDIKTATPRRNAATSKTGKCHVGYTSRPMSEHMQRHNCENPADAPRATRHGCGQWVFVMCIYVPLVFRRRWRSRLIHECWIPSHGLGPHVQRGERIARRLGLRYHVHPDYDRFL